MKSVIICGSISAADEILAVQKQLEERGFAVEIPQGVKKYVSNGCAHVSEAERSADKKNDDLIRRYYNLIKEHDIVLVVNAPKKGVDGYIGGNTFLEIGFGYALAKPVYVLHPLPEVSYRDELDAMDLIVLNGDLDLIE